MVSMSVLIWLVATLVIGQAWAAPVGDALPLGLVSELTAHGGPRVSRLQESLLPLPSPQDLENIKKVAQILVMLGQQVIPGIIGDLPTSTTAGGSATVRDTIPNDEFDDDEHNTT